MNLDIISNKTVKEVKDLTTYSKTSNGNTLNNLTKISKEKDTLSKLIKIVACEGLEGPKHSPNGYKHEKTTEIKDLFIIHENKAPGEGFEPLVLTWEFFSYFKYDKFSSIKRIYQMNGDFDYFFKNSSISL